MRCVLGPDGTPIPVPYWDWVGARLSWISVTLLGSTLLLVGLVLGWLGRVGTSLRLLSHPPFVSPGILRVDGGRLDAPVLFESSDGTHVVRAPRSQLHADLDEVAVGAELLSREPVETLAYRSGIAELPSGAIVVVDRQDVLARRITRARTIAFRLGVAGLVLMVTAALAVVLRV